MNDRPTVALIAATAIAFIIGLAACADQPVEPRSGGGNLRISEAAMQQIAADLVTGAVQGRVHRAIETEILKLEAANPGLGGLYYDTASHHFVVLVTSNGDGERARQDVRTFVGNRGMLTADGVLLRDVPVVVESAEFPFSHLVAWSEVLLPHLSAVDGWQRLDADEHLNKVRIGIESEHGRAEIEALLYELGIPSMAWHIEVVPKLHDLNSLDGESLRDRYRPTGSGIQIRNSLYYHKCTHGWTVKSDAGVWGFLTASHCSAHDPDGTGYTGEPIYQNNNRSVNDLIGHVLLNPAWNRPGCVDTLGTYPYCKWADVMFVAADEVSEIGQRLALPSEWGYPDNRGAIDIDRWVPVDPTLTSKDIVVAFGTTARKVGRTTGYTLGWIEQTCANVVSSGGDTVSMTLCSNIVYGASVGESDSGAPVFSVRSPERIVPYGQLFAGGPLEDPSLFDYPGQDSTRWCEAPIDPGMGDHCFFAYSPITQIEIHLQTVFEYGSGPPAPFSVTLVGPDEIAYFGNYEWTADSEGAVTYQWSRRVNHQRPTCVYQTPWILVGDSVVYTHSENPLDYDFELRVVATSAADETAVDNMMVYPSGRDPICPN